MYPVGSGRDIVMPFSQLTTAILRAQGMTNQIFLSLVVLFSAQRHNLFAELVIKCSLKWAKTPRTGRENPSRNRCYAHATPERGSYRGVRLGAFRLSVCIFFLLA